MRAHVLTGFLLVALGCASHPAPKQQVASSLAAVRTADEAGARDIPEAAIHLRLAEAQIAEANLLMENGDDNLRAEDLALRAHQDAELALAITREQTAEDRLNQLASASSSGGEQMPTTSPTIGQPSTP